MRQTGHLITRLLMDSELESPSLTFLQGCILSAFTSLTSRPNGKGWFLVGICVRAAYSLSLHTLDEDFRGANKPDLSPTEWTRREGFRRAWWAVLECDNFASIVRCKPVSINRERMHVLLPSSDEAWFSETPSTSAFLDDNALASWKQLKLSENRNPHAWYILVNRLLLLGHELSLRENVPHQQREDFRDAVSCVAMGLPSDLELAEELLPFEEHTQGHDNWVMALHLMLQRFAHTTASLYPTSD